MRVYSTLENRAVERRIAELLPGVELVGGGTAGVAECDAAILAAKSLAAGTGVRDVRERLAEAVQAGVPVLLVTRNERLVEYARSLGVADENIITDQKISVRQLAGALQNILAVDDYEIVFDDEGGGPVGAEYRPVADGGPVVVPDGLLAGSCAFLGVKGGVGVSTITSLVCATLDGSVHVEVVGKDKMPSAYCYYGQDSRQTGDAYVLWDVSGEFPPVRGLPLFDISQSVPVEVVDRLLASAGCVVLVADRSEVSFALTGQMLRAGFRPDILVVNAVLPGVGNGAEVYLGEYEEYLRDAHVFELPGGLDEEKAVAQAQRNGLPPCNAYKTASVDRFAGELTSAVRNILGL